MPYPFQPAPPAEGFRGRVQVDIDKCIGCGACASVCPPRLIIMTDHDGKRTLEFQLGKCTYCARCAEVCPEQAITLNQEFELATDNKADLLVTVHLTLAKCERCGEAFATQRIIRKLGTKVSKEMGLEPADLKWLNLCPACRTVTEVQKMTGARS